MTPHFLYYFIILLGFIFHSGNLQAQNPAVNITTFKNGALGAYNLIHDDFGDYGVIGINNYVDTMAYNRGLKITFGAITSSCESNSGMYAKAQSMIYDHHHEIINHSHTHSCAVTNEACGGSGPNYGWAVPGSSQRFNIEIDQSTQSILTNTGIQPRFFIYPYDQFNTASDNYLKAQGYIGSRTGAYNAAAANTITPDADGFFRSPLVVDVGTEGGQVVAQNLNYWVDQAITNNQWVNRELHNVGSTGWGHVTVQNYRNHLNYLKQKVDAGELWVGTVSEILTYQIQKLNYTPTSSWNNGIKTITVNWNTPAFNVADYLQDLHYKSPITLRVDVSNAVHAGNYEVSQNGLTINDYKKSGNVLLINVYPHQGPVAIKVTNCTTLCINTPPQNTTVDEQTSLELSVLATGANPISYQWYKNGSILSGETNATLNIANAALTDAGNYHVVVTNSSTSLTSSSAQVTVTANPCLRLCITQQPANTSANIGQSFALSVNTQGISPMTYQWYRNGVLIPGATSSSYTRSNAVAGDAGNYTVVITNSTGNVTSSPATVEIHNQTPFHGTPIAIPGTIQAEDFDNGGQNVAYYDSTPDNEGDSDYRTSSVDIEELTDENINGYNIGYTTNGEWLEYTVNVAATANYNFRFRTASASLTNGALRIEMNGSTVLTLSNIPNTGSWTTYTNLSVNDIPLTAGVHVMRVYVITGNFNLNYIEVTGAAPLPPTITLNNETRTYGDASFNLSANSTSPGALTYSLVSSSPTGIATVSNTGTVNILGAGTAQIQVQQAASGIYSAGSQTMTLTINKKNLVLTAADKTITYGTSIPALTYTATGFAYSDNASVITQAPSLSTTALPNSNAGTYPITITGGSATNYTLTYNPGTLTINRAVRTLSTTMPSNGYVGYPDAIVYALSPNVGTVEATVTSQGGTAQINNSQLVYQNTGNITLHLTAPITTNYEAVSINHVIQILAPQTPAITFANMTRTYGDLPIQLTASSTVEAPITYSIVSASPSGIVSLNGTQLQISGAGSVTLKAAQAAHKGYTAAESNAVLTINKASLQVVADNKSRLVGEENPVLTLSYSGFVNSDGIASIVPAPTATTTAVPTSSAGDYPIEVSCTEHPNYEITCSNGILSIEVITNRKNSLDNALSIFPNPSENMVHVNTPHEIKKIDVLSSVGVELMSTQETVFDISALQPGVYLLKIHTSSGEVAIRSIIKR